MSSSHAISDTPEKNEEFYPTRVKALHQMFMLSCVMLTFGVVSIVVGIISVSQGGPITFPLTSGSPIWSGCIVCITGLFGFIGSRTPIERRSDISPKLKYMIGLFYGFSISGLSVNGISMGYSIGNVFLCSGTSEKCSSNPSLVKVMVGIAVGTGALLLITAICGSVFFCVYRRAFQMIKNVERMCDMERQIASLQNQVASMQNQNNTATSLNNYGSTPTYSPPQYSEVTGAPPNYSEKPRF